MDSKLSIMRNEIALLLESVLKHSISSADAIVRTNNIKREYDVFSDEILAVSIHQLGHYSADEPSFKTDKISQRYAERILEVCIKYLRSGGLESDFHKELDNVHGRA